MNLNELYTYDTDLDMDHKWYSNIDFNAPKNNGGIQIINKDLPERPTFKYVNMLEATKAEDVDEIIRMYNYKSFYIDQSCIDIALHKDNVLLFKVLFYIECKFLAILNETASEMLFYYKDKAKFCQKEEVYQYLDKKINSLLKKNNLI